MDPVKQLVMHFPVAVQYNPMDKEKVEISSKGYDANSSKHSNENEFLLVKSLHPLRFMLYFALRV